MTYTFRVADFPSLSDQSFPSSDFSEAEEPIMHRCILMGEALSAMPGVRMSADAFGALPGIRHNDQVWFFFKALMVLGFEIPYLITPDSMMGDDTSRVIFLSCITPCILPVAVGSGRSQTRSYEFYHSSVCAR